MLCLWAFRSIIKNKSQNAVPLFYNIEKLLAIYFSFTIIVIRSKFCLFISNIHSSVFATSQHNYCALESVSCWVSLEYILRKKANHYVPTAFSYLFNLLLSQLAEKKINLEIKYVSQVVLIVPVMFTEIDL